jgi:hypothetical protein
LSPARPGALRAALSVLPAAHEPRRASYSGFMDQTGANGPEVHGRVRDPECM